MLDGMKNIILKFIVIVILVIFLTLSGCLNYKDNNEDLNNEYVRDDVARVCPASGSPRNETS